MRKILNLCLLLVLTRAMTASGAPASGTILGSVSDQTGAAIVAAKVTFREKQTNFIRLGLTGSTGDYSEPLLPPGTYDVTFEAAGFRKTVLPDISLQVDQVERLDVSLKIGSVTQTLIITGQQPLLEIDNSGLGSVLGAKQVSTLPLNARDFLSFALLVPGV